MDNTTEPRPKRKLSLGKGLSIALLLTVVGLELGARVIDRLQGRSANTYAPVDPLDSFYEPHPFLGFTLKPGSFREPPASAAPGEGYSFHINSLGFRGKEITKAKPPGVYRILCVGGSTTYGTGATRDEKTYPAQLERLLNASGDGRKFEVVNCGTVGYGTAENLINLELRLLDLRPDAVIIYHAANDALALQMKGFKSDYSHLRTAWTQTKSNPLDNFLLRNVRLYAWATRGLDPAKLNTNLQTLVTTPEFKTDFLQPGEPLDPEALPTFQRNLVSIAAVVRAAGAEVLFSTFGTCAAAKKPTDGDYLATVAAQNQVIEAVAREEAVPMLDVASYLDDKRPLFDDWMHLNDPGEVAHAEAVRAELPRQGPPGRQ